MTNRTHYKGLVVMMHLPRMNASDLVDRCSSVVTFAWVELIHRLREVLSFDPGFAFQFPVYASKADLVPRRPTHVPADLQLHCGNDEHLRWWKLFWLPE